MQKKQLRDSYLYESRFGFQERNANFIFAHILLAVVLLFAFFRIWFISSFIGVTVSGNSMRETLQNGDKLLTYRVTEHRKAQRGDVVIVDVRGYEECKNVSGGLLIKRLIAVEGDKVKCVEGQTYVWYKGGDGYELLDESGYAYYGDNDEHKPHYNFSEYTVGEGEIFFLGDNRSGYLTSTDSRYKDEYGVTQGSHLDCLYKEEDIIGIVPEWSMKHKKFLGDMFIPDEQTDKTKKTDKN